LLFIILLTSVLNEGFEIFTSVNIYIVVFSVMTLCSVARWIWTF